jgi:hypothetical protein
VGERCLRERKGVRGGDKWSTHRGGKAVHGIEPRGSEHSEEVPC